MRTYEHVDDLEEQKQFKLHFWSNSGGVVLFVLVVEFWQLDFTIMDKDGDNNSMNLDYDDKRKTYSLNFKRRLVKTLLEKHAGNVSATAIEFHVSRSNVIRWRGQTGILEKANANRLLNSIARRRYRVGKSKYPLLDESVREMVKERRAAKKSVTMKRIQRYARQVFPNLYPEAEIEISALLMAG